MDRRERIARSVEGGSSMREAARRFAVSASAALKLMRRVRETGSAAPARVGGHRPPALAARTKDALWTAMGNLLATFTPAECAIHLAHAGYESTQLGKCSGSDSGAS